MINRAVPAVLHSLELTRVAETSFKQQRWICLCRKTSWYFHEVDITYYRMQSTHDACTAEHLFFQLFKMDVEGFEVDAIQGSMQVVSKIMFFLSFGSLIVSSSFKVISYPTYSSRSNRSMTGLFSSPPFFVRTLKPKVLQAQNHLWTEENWASVLNVLFCFVLQSRSQLSQL